MPVAEVVGALLSKWVSQSIRTEAACVLNRTEQDVGQKRKTCTPKSTKARPRSCARAWDGGRGTGDGGQVVVQGAPRSGGRGRGVGNLGKAVGVVWECASGSCAKSALHERAEEAEADGTHSV
jgi:hypothetical protein